jgi:RNA polymerase sigma-70 factor (ECF subfamily)
MSEPSSESAEFETLFRQCGPAVLAFLLRRTSRDLAEDVMAETFTVAWRRRQALPSPPLPWLIGTARNLLLNQRRSARRRQALTERLETAYNSHAAADDTTSVRAALGTLKEEEREVLMLVAWDELSARDAAAVLGCSEVAFRLRLHRARKRLRSALAEWDTQADRIVTRSVAPREMT